jgi:SAM-dependent methyltransferase
VASVSENRKRWSDYYWNQQGHEWSPGGTRTGTEMLWWRSIRPRLHGVLPAGTLLEIAPGFGRWTEYLLHECHDVIGVDATERCVGVCRERFAGRPARFEVNDGRTLPMIADASVDAVFSFDSLVHVEAPEIASYLEEIARCLRPGGLAFLHHSNLGAYADPATGRIPGYVTRKGWRAPSMSARGFRDICRRAGLDCLAQEMITWRIRGPRPYRVPGHRLPLTDCFSTVARPLHGGVREPTRLYVNRDFVSEWDEVTTLGALYCSREEDAECAPPDGTGNGRPAAPALRVWRTARGHLSRRVLAMREPIVRALDAARCPDCRGPLTPASCGQHCAGCRVIFIR